MASDTEERPRVAFLRLIAGKPKVVAENTKLSPFAAEKEAGCGVSSLRCYSSLFTEVQKEKKKTLKQKRLKKINIELFLRLKSEVELEKLSESKYSI